MEVLNDTTGMDHRNQKRGEYRGGAGDRRGSAMGPGGDGGGRIGKRRRGETLRGR